MIFEETASTPKYGQVTLDITFSCEAIMRCYGYTEETGYRDDHYVVLGKKENGDMRFARSFKNEYARKFLALAKDEVELEEFLSMFAAEADLYTLAPPVIETATIFNYLKCVAGSMEEEVRVWIWGIAGLDFYALLNDVGNCNYNFLGFALKGEVLRTRCYHHETGNFEYMREEELDAVRSALDEETGIRQQEQPAMVPEEDFKKFINLIFATSEERRNKEYAVFQSLLHPCPEASC